MGATDRTLRRLLEKIAEREGLVDLDAAANLLRSHWDGDARPFPVFLVGMPVGETLNQSIDSLVRMVQAIAAGPVELKAAYQPIARA